MAIFKRFEVWLLLVLSIAGVGYVLWSENQPKDPDSDSPDPELAEEEELNRFKIREVRTVPDGENQVIEIDLLARSDSSEPEELTPEKVRLLARHEGDDEEIELPTFFLPFDPPPTLAPDSETIVTLKYWLESQIGKPNPSLRLEIFDESLEITGGAANEEDPHNDDSGSFGSTNAQF